MIFKLTFEQFYSAPREGALLDMLRTLPVRIKTPEEQEAFEATEKAYEALCKAGLGWLLLRPAQAMGLSKAKRKLWDAYNRAWERRAAIQERHREEAQRYLYDQAVKAGHILTS